MAFLRRGSVDPERLPAAEQGALARVLLDPTFELIPLKNVREQVDTLPRGAEVSITASPAKGIEATVELSAELKAEGFRAIPHLSARMVRDRAHLAELLARLRETELSHAFVVGGDAEEPGEFLDGLSLLRAMAELGGGPAEVGVPCYPEGHAVIPDEALLRALRDKAPFARYMTTQLCFNAKAIAAFVAEQRTAGNTLSVKLGVPGVAEVAKLITISARIGIKDTARFMSKNTGFVKQLMLSGPTFRPTGLLGRLAPLIADPAADVIGLHVYTFNQVPSTEAWRAEYLAALGVEVAAAPVATV